MSVPASLHDLCIQLCVVLLVLIYFKFVFAIALRNCLKYACL